MKKLFALMALVGLGLVAVGCETAVDTDTPDTVVTPDDGAPVTTDDSADAPDTVIVDPAPEGTDPAPEGTEPAPAPEGTEPAPAPEGTEPAPEGDAAPE